MLSWYIAISALCFTLVSSKTVEVHTATDLQKALNDAEAGDTIKLADGSYSGNFLITKNGSQDKPITLIGSRKAVLSNNGSGKGYGLHLEYANHWILNGFTVANSKKGIILDTSSNNLLTKLELHSMYEEGIHMRYESSDNTVAHCLIRNTGTRVPGFGEGLYLGQAVNNWRNGKPDHSLRNNAISNHFGPYVRAEAIDIKEGTCCGLIGNNTFDGTGMSGLHFADSWMDIKGDNYTMEYNVGDHSLNDGFQLHFIKRSGVGGCNNVFRGNICKNLGEDGVCINIVNKKCRNIIEHDGSSSM